MESFAGGADTLVARCEHLPFSRIDDSIIAIDREQGYCFAMNLTSARVWELISTPVRISSLCDSLCAEFAVDPDTCRRDLLSIMTEMKENGLVKEAN